MIGQDKVLLASKYFEKGYAFQKNGDLEKAIEGYKTSIKYYPTARAYTFLGWAYSLQGKFDIAIEVCYQAIDINAGYADSYIDIGVYLIELNRIEEGIIWLEKGIDLIDFNSSYYALYHLGRAYEKKGKWITAIRYYNESLHSNSEFETAQKSAIRLSALLN